MRFSEAWLREWVNPDISTDTLADQLSMAGLEVDSVEPAAPAFDGVVVGEVLSREAHPDADKLSVCTVAVGDDEPVQIVCGAKNVAAGMKVPVAKVGAKLPGDFKIKKAKLRGVQSLGMICSASELGLAESSEGIMPLPAESVVGKSFRDYLSLDDACIEVDLTPDRGDCLSVAGIAREVGVINRTPLSVPEIAAVAPGIDDRFTVELEAAEACPHYVCRVVRGIDPQAESPQWLRERLRRGGVRPISPVVDVTNYVMLELGQPMHGFDLAKLKDKIRVRLAQTGERLRLLDGSEIELSEGTLVIADAERTLALAGIMGGEDSGVSETTRDVLLESAYFAPLAITGKARAYGLHTDSSHRFERGVDPQLQVKAIERATELLLLIVGGQAGPLTEAVSEAHLPTQPIVRLRRERIPRVLGVQIEDAQVEDILQRLGMELHSADDGWDVVPPSARFDIGIEVDLIEEIGRIYGYARIPENLSAAPVSVVTQAEGRFQLDRAKLLLVDRDYQEAVTYAFISPEMAQRVTPQWPPITLANPISADMAVMRASLWPGLLSTLQYNLARQQDRVRLFESGLRFRQVEGELVQDNCLSGLICGPIAAEQWAAPSRPIDFYDAKADVEAVLGLSFDSADLRFEPVEDPALHPGQGARIVHSSGQELGLVGLVHPALSARLDIPKNVFMFEIDLTVLPAGRIPAFAPISKFPAIRRDLALVVDRSVSFGALHQVARRAAPSIVRALSVFDVYTGENIDSGLKSVALSLILQESSHTLTDDEVDRAEAAILSTLASELGAQRRE